ncbi:CoA-binding protein [Hazenella sp. IB182357]|uniref:CoA-binding protein n=1 Tax=Polycladospora coralii TaxID=2771432 RepID=A0A926N6Y1_9BACL|nr:CoA-binding protein [Polycladospora coralii]MBD1370911.1 CoA-binding protein [Polycladospora coralii]MBS7529850.1 CoA-binding protein [Polycladospora coralii]
MHNNPNELERKKMLDEARHIAVVGLSDKPERTSYMIAEALQKAGYRIFPVNPKLTDFVLGEKPYASLTDIEEKIDIVNVFRRSETVFPVVEEAVKIGAKVVWMQQGVQHEEAATYGENHGLTVVMDRCIKVDHAILLKKGKQYQN